MVKTPLKDVFKAETVVVQNAGMARWLSMEMAQTAGISANTKFLFPAEFMWDLLRLVSPEIPEHSQCAPDTLRFHIFEELSNNFKNYPELHHYILNSNEVNQLHTWELSCQSARLLDQYLFYRSEWINTWEKTADNSSTNTAKEENHWSNHWQARLWNRCIRDKKLLHWLALQEQFSQNLDSIDESLLAERICFFSMSALSPGYVELLGGIAHKTDIHIFIINPCEDVYWGDIQSPKTHAKLDKEEQGYTEIGNPLLASLGKQGRDFIDKLLSLSEQNGVHSSVAGSNDNSTLLGQIQHDIYNLKKPEFEPHLSSIDGSILFNSCHTAMREVEVLHDRILAELDADCELVPSDIVVMMPDIEKYAPYIESVFSSEITTQSNYKSQKLPFSIADRDPQNIFKLIQALNKLLTLQDSRFDVEAVFELLEYDDIRQHFGLDQDQLHYCRELVLSTNIRWGISDNTREQSDLPNTEEHTWKYALDRMLLGYSLSNFQDNESSNVDSGEQLFKSSRNLALLPYTEIEGNNALVLANFKCFLETIFVINDWQTDSLGLDKWLAKTYTLIQKISPESPDQQRIIKALSDLQLKADLADFELELSFVVYQKMLQQCLADISANEKYLGYGITFCALVPMRSVPFKIVALMGMNDGEFPRQDSSPSFDLMAEKKRRGDRSRRDEDRYLFLESILAARSKLLISFMGQSIKDNSELAPSILVSELLDTITINSGIEAEDWIVQHPLQAFNPKYFLPSFSSSSSSTEQKMSSKDQYKQVISHPLFSYASQYLQLNKKNIAPENLPAQTLNDGEFISAPLEALGDEFKYISLFELISFFKNPARAFLKTRFSIQTYDFEKELNIREPFELESFKDREIRNLILSSTTTEDTEINQKKLIARAKGLLPYGQIGDEIFSKEKHTIDVFKELLMDVDYLPDHQVSISFGDFHLEGKLDQLTTNGRYIKQVTQPYAADFIDIWLTHLCLNAYASSKPDMSLNRCTEFHSPEKSFRLDPVNDAKQQLKVLLEHYWQGLHFPLLFFPKSAFACYSKKGSESIPDMLSKWNGNDHFTGEKDSFEHWLLHRNLILDTDNQPEKLLQINADVFEQMFAVFTEL